MITAQFFDTVQAAIAELAKIMAESPTLPAVQSAIVSAVKDLANYRESAVL